jgi:hypothetical protein
MDSSTIPRQVYSDAMGKAVWKILATGSAVLAGLLATKVADLIWRTAGQDRVDPKDPQAPARQAVAYAALTALTTAAAKTVATRKAAAYYEQSAGHPPAALRAASGADQATATQPPA